MEWEKTYEDLKRLNWFTLLIMGVISHFFLNPSMTLGIILGGLIIMANFSVLQHSIRRGFSPEGIMCTTKVFIVVKYYLRLIALAVIIALLIKQGRVDPVGLALGLSTVVIGIVSFGIKRALSMFLGEAA